MGLARLPSVGAEEAAGRAVVRQQRQVNGGLVALAAEPEMPISEAAEQVSHRIGVPGTRAASLAYFQ
jgi:hypothetical protein